MNNPSSQIVRHFDVHLVLYFILVMSFLQCNVVLRIAHNISHVASVFFHVVPECLPLINYNSLFILSPLPYPISCSELLFAFLLLPNIVHDCGKHFKLSYSHFLFLVCIVCCALIQTSVSVIIFGPQPHYLLLLYMELHKLLSIP